MSEFRLFCITLLLLTASSAVSQDVVYNFDDKADFSKFKTYKWITLKSEAPIDELTDEQIKAALAAALAQKGLTKTDGDIADLFIGYQTTQHREREFAEFNAGWSTGPGWYAGGWHVSGGGNSKGQSSVLYKGQLAVDMYDPANHNLIWRGVASKTLDPKAKAGKTSEESGQSRGKDDGELSAAKMREV
jgi:hypothetical protein